MSHPGRLFVLAPRVCVVCCVVYVHACVLMCNNTCAGKQARTPRPRLGCTGSADCQCCVCMCVCARMRFQPRPHTSTTANAVSLCCTPHTSRACHVWFLLTFHPTHRTRCTPRPTRCTQHLVLYDSHTFHPTRQSRCTPPPTRCTQHLVLYDSHLFHPIDVRHAACHLLHAAHNILCFTTPTCSIP